MKLRLIFTRYLPLTLALAGLIAGGVAYFVLSSKKEVEAAWYSPAWTYRKAITIDKNKVVLSSTSTSTTFSSTGGTSWVVPTGITSITIKAWGAGGGGGGQGGSAAAGGAGGGGAYVTSVISVTPGETLTMDVGGGGGGASAGCLASGGGGAQGASATGKGGAGGSMVINCSGPGGGGGGGTFIRRGATILAVAGGGGGGGGTEATGGAGAGGGGGVNGANSTGGCNATGGTAGGSASTTGVTGLVSGSDASAGGGGGGGLLGGGGGGFPSCDAVGAAGGGGGTSFGDSTTNGSGTTPGNNSDPSYTGSVGVGGASQTAGNNGYIVVTYINALTNFPMVFSVTDPDLKFTGSGGKVGLSDGTDMLFTSADGTTKLDHEIEKYSSTTGETIMWVEVPYLVNSVDTTLYLYFGNAGASNQTNATGVWDSSYKGVWHLSSNTAAAATDSTSNAYNGTVNGPTAMNGNIGGGLRFAGGTQNVTFSDINDFDFGSNDFTISYWAQNASTTPHGSSYIMTKYPSPATCGNFSFWSANITSVNTFGFQIDEDTLGTDFNGFPTNTTLGTNVWHYFTARRTGNLLALYVDGKFDRSSTTLDTTFISNNGNYYWGQSPCTVANFEGNMNEIRISNGIARSADWIATEYNNQSSPGTFYAYGQTEIQRTSVTSYTSGAGSAWYSPSWGFRKQITIDKGKVSATSTLTNFPMLFSVTDPDLRFTSFGGNVGLSTGNDVLFTSADGTTKLDHEIEKYASSTGETVAWVEIPTLSTSTDTTIYMYFGNSGASNQQNATGVWDSNYLAVWHMADNAASTTILDSTSNGRNGTSQANTNTKNITGKIGQAQNFNGSTDYIVSSNYGLPTSFTIQAWGNSTGAGNVFSEQGATIVDNGSGWYDSQLEIQSTGIVKSCVWNGSLACVNAASVLKFNTWHMFATRYSSSATTLAGIVDGFVGANNTSITRQTPSTSNTYWAVGFNTATNAGNTAKFSGSIDEVRVSNIARSDEWMRTEYNNLSSPNTFYSYGGLQSQTRTGGAGVSVESRGSGGAGWYSASWGYRKQITIDKNKVAGTSTLSNFPLLFSVTDNDLKFTSFGGKVASSTGNDILFTSSDGTTKLDHEIEKYASSTGETLAWVEIPSLATSTDTTIYVYFGNSAASNQQNVTGTWDSSYKGVWHLPNGTTLTALDSTSNAANGTVTGATATTGQVGGAANFNKANPDYIQISGLMGNNATLTFSSWIKLVSNDLGSEVISIGDHAALRAYDTGTLFGFYYQGGGFWNSVSYSVDLRDNRWHYVSYVANPGNSTQRLYLDGVRVASATNSTAISYTGIGTNTQIGRHGDGSANQDFDGKIDEPRVSSSDRSDGWIRTEYNNQVSPGSFYSLGALSVNGRTDSTGTTSPTTKIRGGVKIR